MRRRFFFATGRSRIAHQKAGDLDDTMKTFIDALEMPPENAEGDESDDMSHPLLENDTLIRGLEIFTERLSLPEGSFPNRVHLVIKVAVSVERVGPWNICLL